MTDFLFADTHFGLRSYSMIWWNAQKRFIYEQFIPAIKQYKEVRIIHLGDVFDNRSGVNILIARGVRKIFKDLAALPNVQEIIVIAGNHDFYSPVSDSDASLDIVLNHIPKVRLVIRENYETETELFVPWYKAEAYNESGWPETDKTIYTHTDLSHADCKSVIYSGHIHYPSDRGNSHCLGSCFPQTFADSNASRYFYIREDGGELIKQPNKLGIKFWRLYNEQIFNDIRFYEHDYIELYIEQENLVREDYHSRISELRGQYKNIWVIPQRQEAGIEKIDTAMDMEQIIESHIPDPLKEKFEKIKQMLE